MRKIKKFNKPIEKVKLWELKIPSKVKLQFITRTFNMV